MFLVKLLRLLTGYVEFSAHGGFADRFLNLCTLRRVPLWDVVCRDGVVKACTDTASYKLIRFPARRSGMRVRITAKRGLIFAIMRHKCRVGLLAGAALFLAVLVVMSTMLWEITVEGNEKIHSEEFIATLEELGVKRGVRKSSLNTQEIQKGIMLEYPQLMWASLNILGSSARLEVRESEPVPKIIDLSTPVNIVASKDGRIIYIEVDIGEKTVKEGSAVLKGDLLISGVTENADGSESLRHAKGKVLAQTRASLYGVCELKKTVTAIISTNVKYYLRVFSLDIPLGFSRNQEDYSGKYSCFRMLKGEQAVLPLGIGRSSCYETERREMTLTRQQAALGALLDAVLIERDTYKDVPELKIERSLMQGEKAVTVKSECHATENIAVEQEIYIEKMP